METSHARFRDLLIVYAVDRTLDKTCGCMILSGSELLFLFSLLTEPKDEHEVIQVSRK